VEEQSAALPPLLGGNPAARWFANLPVGAKISAALAVAVIAGVAASAIGMMGLSTAAGNATAIYEENLQPTAALASAQGSFDDEIFNLAMMNIASSGADIEKCRQSALDAADLLAAGVKSYQDLGLGPAQEQPATQLNEALAALPGRSQEQRRVRQGLRHQRGSAGRPDQQRLRRVERLRSRQRRPSREGHHDHLPRQPAADARQPHRGDAARCPARLVHRPTHHPSLA
jgi:hypothetical protein